MGGYAYIRRQLIVAFALGSVLFVLGCSEAGGGVSDNTIDSGNTLGLSASQLSELTSRTSGSYGSSTQAQNGLHVTGVGTIYTEPDLAVLSLGVTAFAKTVSGARGVAAEAMNGIVVSLKALGVENNAIETTRIAIQPEYKWEASQDGGGNKHRLIGYTFTNMLSVKVRDLESIGRIIDEAVVAGGDVTRVNSVSFSLEEGQEVARLARRLAVQDALNKAEQIAQEAGVVLGDLQFISEVSAPQYGREADVFLSERMAMSAEPTTVFGGDQSTVVQIQAVFGIR